MYLRIIDSIRTNNFQDPAVMEKIGQLWQDHQKEMEEAFAQGLPFYAVYHDYASDYKGDYSLSLCILTDEEGWDFDISEQNYQIFEVAGTDPQAILETWQVVWQAEEAGELVRDYSLDFEKYEANQAPVIFIAEN